MAEVKHSEDLVFDGANELNQGFDIADPNGGVMGTAYWDSSKDAWSVRVAELNARLFAASPKLLRALKNIVKAWRSIPAMDQVNEEMNVNDLWSDAEEAINEAGGGVVMKKTCAMCEEKPARKLTAEDVNGDIYINAEDVVIFCSKRCAANWALLWYTDEGRHFCLKSMKWTHCSEHECRECRDVG